MWMGESEVKLCAKKNEIENCVEAGKVQWQPNKPKARK